MGWVQARLEHLSQDLRPIFSLVEVVQDSQRLVPPVPFGVRPLQREQTQPEPGCAQQCPDTGTSPETVPEERQDAQSNGSWSHELFP